MKKTLLIAMALLLLGATWALADVSVTGTVDKTKTVRVVEKVSITKDVDVSVTVTALANQGAEADSLLNQSNTTNNVNRHYDVGQYDNVYRKATIGGSIRENTGIVNVNQETGNSINQANLVEAAVAWTGAEDVTGFANSQASMEQINTANYVEAYEDYEAGPQKTDLIGGSINDNTGVVNVNQSVGNMNNQANQIVIAVASEALVALAEADLGQTNARNTVIETGTVRLDSIRGSINGNRGVVNVNQSAGNMNNQANVISISASVPFSGGVSF